jgi:hypothetical protein
LLICQCVFRLPGHPASRPALLAGGNTLSGQQSNVYWTLTICYSLDKAVTTQLLVTSFCWVKFFMCFISFNLYSSLSWTVRKISICQLYTDAHIAV